MTDTSAPPTNAVPGGSALLARPVAPLSGSRRGAGLTEFRLAEGFWGRLQQTNATTTLGHCLDWMERLGWLANFDRVATGETARERPGWQFSDSEVYKLLEALAWERGRSGSPEAEAMFVALVERIGPAQDEDGYLNTCFGHAGQQPRYSDLEEGHELYCLGHLLQAAVARARVTGPRDPLVEIARRAADHVCREFGAGAREGICGHPEIEVGLAEFGRLLGEPRYLEQARLFIERRGRGTLRPIPLLSAAYFQDDVPVREAQAWRGHAVRALYLAAGALDVAVDTGDDELLDAVRRQWSRTVERRTYLTGGMGSRHQDEGFGEDWELPADRAYCETCAGIASIMVSWRLFLATGEARYADLMERTFYNVLATSPRADGRAFFYANPLQQREAGSDVEASGVNPRAEGGVRAPWFEVSCCPTNVARTLASWQSYAAAVEDDAVTLLQYAAGEGRFALADGAVLALGIITSYPGDGEVRIEIREAPARPVALRLRVPGWATGATLSDAGGPRSVVEPGWAMVEREFQPGEELVLRLPLEPRMTWPHPRVDGLRGTAAIERGPLVLCLESTDLPEGVDLADVRLDAEAPVRAVADGAVAAGRVQVASDPDGTPPFQSQPGGAEPSAGGPAVDLRLIPYHRWAEREPSAMRIFIPVSSSA
ncbi:glycoside hydrolase family 127 protein [Bogoriella caseilytica]|uniref:Glycoside hydrolase family 127 protein n=1 Tax=Bogoriella caseilytica TaxID=56055 RepID=A0A3N2BBF2_9MICO|nr:beta-L-arabinofuranosidase domain-containing protein [Bogoriella caseilytica]ROR72589.1 hypothetical protein EDD31_0944 [Bogoriella caseilytica]